MGLNARGLAEFNKAGRGPRLQSSAVLGSVRSTHMQIGAINWDCQGGGEPCQGVHISGGAQGRLRDELTPWIGTVGVSG